MKKFCIIILLIALYASTGTLPAITQAQAESKIVLKEIASKPSPRSPAPPICEAVEVVQSATGVYIGFISDLGSLTVEVTDTNGATVFQQTVNAEAGGSLAIATKGWAAGTYLIRILNGQGAGCEGQFEI